MQVALLWTDITDLLVVVFQRSFLCALRRITIEYPGPHGSVVPVLDLIGQRKFWAAVSQYALNLSLEQFRAKDHFQKEDAIYHVLGGLGRVVVNDDLDDSSFI